MSERSTGFVPDEFEPPRSYVSARLTLAVLSAANAEQDYECVMTSAEAIRGVFGPDNGWPDRAMTYAMNLADVERHEGEFNARKAFAYSIFEHIGGHRDERRYAGCLYIKPLKSRIENDRRKALFQAQAFCWFSSSTNDPHFGTAAANELMQWLADSWPFNAVAFPGRSIGWEEWTALATAER
jgi:hypothetical protein